MASSLVNPLTCGFAKVAVHFVFSKKKNIDREKGEGMSKYKARIFQLQHEEFQYIFKDRKEAFKVDYKNFQRSMQKLRQCMAEWGRNGSTESKRLYLDSFSVEKWDKLSNAKKDQHTLSNCKGCYHHFPEI